MDGGEAVALVAAGVGGWVLGRRRTEHPHDEEHLMTDTRANASFADRVERGGHQIADRLGVAVGTGGVKAAVVSARGVRSVANLLASGAGKSVAVLEGAGARLGSVVERGRARDGNGSAPGPDHAEPSGGGDLADLAGAQPTPDVAAAYDAPDAVVGDDVVVDELAPDVPGDVPPFL